MDEIKKIYEHSDDLHVRLYLLYEGSDENLYYDPELTKQAEAADVINLFMKGLGVVDQNGVVHKDLSCSADGIVSYGSGGGSDGGGVIVVTFNFTEDDVTASHTPAEVFELAKSNMLIANMAVRDEIQPIGSFITDNAGKFGFGISVSWGDESVDNVHLYIYAEISDMSTWKCPDW